MPRRRSLLLAGVLIGELIAALVCTAQRPPIASSQSVEHRSSVGVTPDRTVRTVSLGGSDADRLLARVSAEMHSAVDAVTGFWGADWSPEISVLATASDEQFRAAAGGGPASQWTDIAAVTVADRVDPRSRTVVGARIVFAPGAVRMSAGALRIVLAHELFHYAARPDTALDAPRWLTEGVADYVARPPTAVPAAATAQSLPSDADLDAVGPQRSLAYDRAWWFARFVADTYGQAKLRELYVAACGAVHVDMPTAVGEVLGTDTPGVLVRWQQWMARP